MSFHDTDSDTRYPKVPKVSIKLMVLQKSRSISGISQSAGSGQAALSTSNAHNTKKERCTETDRQTRIRPTSAAKLATGCKHTSSNAENTTASRDPTGTSYGPKARTRQQSESEAISDWELYRRRAHTVCLIVRS